MKTRIENALLSSTSQCRRGWHGPAERVLIIEDDAYLLDIYRTFVQSLSIITDCCRTLEEAESLLNEHDYSFIILDGQFPESYNSGASSNFHHVLSHIRQNMKTRYFKPYVVMLSGYNDPLRDHRHFDEERICDEVIPKSKINFFQLTDRVQKYKHGLTYGRRLSDDIRISVN